MIKKLMLCSMTALLFSAVSFAGNGDKGKDKNKKAHSSCTKGCPGKECSKQKATAKS